MKNRKRSLRYYKNQNKWTYMAAGFQRYVLIVVIKNCIFTGNMMLPAAPIAIFG